MLTTLYKIFNPYKTGLLLASLCLCISCTPALPPADLGRAEQLRNDGFIFNLKHDYASAAERYKEATLYDPLNSTAYLHLADLFETLEQPIDAVDTYERALRYLPATDNNREFIIYRSALLLAAKLDKPGKAENLLGQLSTPALQNDLSGVIAMYQDNPSQSLKYFQNALKYEMEQNQFARVYYHIAQAYYLAGDDGRSSDALLIAVGKATSRPLKEDIRRFFEAMLARK